MSLATADRVVNQRDGVRGQTIARVELAIAKLGYRANAAAMRLARNESYRFAFILPSNANSFMSNLSVQVERASDWLAGQNGYIDVMHVDVFDPNALATALEPLSSTYHGVATVALDHTRVRAAIDDLVARGVHVVTLVSDAPSSRRAHYVGVDNPAAGRTAASLMGRFLGGRKGKVGVIVGSMSLRDHTERHFGFHQVLSGEYPDLVVLPAREGRDDCEQNRALAVGAASRTSRSDRPLQCGRRQRRHRNGARSVRPSEGHRLGCVRGPGPEFLIGPRTFWRKVKRIA